MSAPIRLKDPYLSSKTYTFTFSFGGLAALLTIFTLALTVFFVLGVVVGRGHRPENMLPPVARVMPTDAPPPNGDEVLRADQLDYNQRLSGTGSGPNLQATAAEQRKAAPVAAAPVQTARPVPITAGPAPTPARPAVPVQAARPVPITARPGVQTAAAAPRQPAEKPDPDNHRYDYAYQVASFPDQAEARTFLTRVKAEGLKAGVEEGTTNGKTWRRVVVFFRGTPTDTRGLKAKLATVGVAHPIMRSKTPAN